LLGTIHLRRKIMLALAHQAKANMVRGGEISQQLLATLPNPIKPVDTREELAKGNEQTFYQHW